MTEESTTPEQTHWGRCPAHRTGRSTRQLPTQPRWGERIAGPHLAEPGWPQPRPGGNRALRETRKQGPKPGVLNAVRSG